MKGAILWKRILNEGLAGYLPGKDVEADIIKAQIIVDDRPCDRQMKSPQLMPISVPFEKTFIECAIEFVGVEKVNQFGESSQTDFSGSVEGRIGALVWVLKNEAGFSVRLDCISCEPSTPPNFFGSIKFECDKNGLPSSKYTSMVPERFSGSEKMLAAIEQQLKCARFAVCDTLSMLTCKNIDLAPHDNDPKQVRRAIKRHGGNPDSYRYHTLVVRPAGAHKDSPAQEIGIMPRHVCRGHFAEYGPEFNKGLLFGKFSGRFYIPPHLKGDKKNGIVEKDYAIPAAVS